jgi:hypothetical protein
MLAGVEGIQKQTFVGPHLVSPVPMAYIRLGDARQLLGLVEATPNKFASASLQKPSIFQGCLTFIRTSLNTQTISCPQSRKDFPLEQVEIRKQKLNGAGRLRSLKRQRLDDVLNGFQVS